MCRLKLKILFLCFFIFEHLFCVTGKSKAIRDPFNLSLKLSKKDKDLPVKLLGIVNSENSYGAVLESNGKIETVFLNDNFFEFKVLKIGADSVELIRKKRKTRLFIE